MRTDRFALVLFAACAVALCASARPVKAEGSIMLGDQWWTQTAPESKYQEFRDIPHGPFLESLSLADWNGRNTYTLSGRNGMQNDQAWQGMWAYGTKLNVKASWIETPHRFSNTARSPYTEVSPGVFVLPDSLQALNQRVTSGNSIPNALQDALNASRTFPLGFSTNVAAARVRVRPQQGWMFEVNGRQTTRAGRKAYGAFIGTSPGNPMVELWEPIDQTMTDGDVRANYNNPRVTVQVIGGMSVFDNHVDRMTWDNSRRLYDSNASGPARGQLALAPDNTEVRGSVAVGVRLPRKSLFTGTVGLARITQDQDWLPVTINQALRPDTIRVPGTNTDGRADVMNYDARLTTLAVDHVRGTLRFHQDKYDNKTPEWTFRNSVNADYAVVGPFETKPFGNSNWVAGVDLDADPNSKLSVGVTAEVRTRERTHREIDKDKETVFGGRLRVRPMDGLALDGKVRVGERKLDKFFDEDYQSSPGVWIEQPETRRPDVANRQQTLGQGGLSWMPMEKFDLSATYSYLKNEYKDLSYGLQSDQSSSIQSQGTLHATPRLDLRGGYGYTETKTAQRSIQGLVATLATTGLRDTLAWTADIKDKNVFVTAGFELWVRPGKLSFVGDYEFSRDFVEFDLTAGPGFYSPFLTASNRFVGDPPATLYRRHNVLVEARYQLLKSTQLTGRYGWEEFDAIDFAAKDVPQVASGAAALYLGDFYKDYRAHRLALLVKHTF